MPEQPLTSADGSQQPVTTATPQQPVTQQVSPVDKPAQSMPVNLHALPEFRSVQSAYEKQIAELRKQANEAKMAGLDDFERVQYENGLLKEQLSVLEAERQALAEEQARAQQLREIAQESGTPLSILEQATSPVEAYRLALQYTRQQAVVAPPPVQPAIVPAQTNGNSWSQPQTAPEAPAHVPDLGQGAAQSGAEQLIARAWNSGDETLYVRALRELREQGR